MSDNEIERLKEEIASIKERNARVEMDKGWETSKTRTLSICIITYLFASIYIYLVQNKGIWLSALVPVIGFYLSTQSLPIIKNFWIKKRQGNSL